MRPLRLHPRVYEDIDEPLAFTRAHFGRQQVAVYARLIVEGRLMLRRHPTIGGLRPELGDAIRVFSIARPRLKAPHGYIYRAQIGETPAAYAAICVRQMEDRDRRFA